MAYQTLCGKNFAKCLDTDGEALNFLKTLFPKLTEAKIKECINTTKFIFVIGFIPNKFEKLGIFITIGGFVGPEVHKLMQTAEFEQMFTPKELQQERALKKLFASF